MSIRSQNWLIKNLFLHLWVDLQRATTTTTAATTRQEALNTLMPRPRARTYKQYFESNFTLRFFKHSDWLIKNILAYQSA